MIKLNNMNDYLKKIKEKLEKYPELNDEIESYMIRLSEIFEGEVDLNITYNFNVENYSKKFDEYNEDDLSKYASNTMNLEDLLNILNTEKDTELKLAIDPIYLNKGINDINDVLLTTYENKIIIVPVSKNKNNEENNRN